MGTQLPLPQRDTAPNFRPISVVAKWLHGSRCHMVLPGGTPRPRQPCIRWGLRSPPQKGGRSPQTLTLVCGQPAGWIQMALGMEVGLGPGHIVLDGDPAPLPKKGSRVPQFSAHFYCGQTAACIKMPLGMEVGLSPGDFVLDEDTASPPQKGAEREPPIFGPSIVAKQLHGSRYHLVRR